jgi:nitrate reductase assembly molybdenum cofactor insertion protein NarJ
MLTTMAGTDDIQRVAAALDRSRDGDVRSRDVVRNLLRSVEASRQLEVFLERVGDLTAEELRELYAETFHDETSSDRRMLAGLARSPTNAAEAGVAVEALGSLLARLEAERNPFAYVVRSLCCLLPRAKSSQLEQESR